MNKATVLNRSKMIINENSSKVCLENCISSFKPLKRKKIGSLRPASALFYSTDKEIEEKQKKIADDTIKH